MAGIGLNRSRQAPAEETPSFGAIAERFRRAGDLERAIALCQEGLKKFPNQLSARVTLGWAYLDKGEYDHARQELERVIRRAPDNLAAIRGLAELHDRAEHAVSGIGPDGMWVPAEDVPEEPDAVSPVAVQGPAPAEPEPFEAPMPAVPPPLPVPALASSNDDVNPLSLIETPAQAAVAHSGHAADAAPVVSVFEQVIEHAAVLAASPEPVVENAADWREPDVTPAETSLAALDEIADVWEPVVPVSASEPASDAVLLAENAEVELDRVASEFGVSESDPVASEVVIDLPEADDVLPGELEQFEATQPVEETAEFEAAALDPVLPPAGIDAAEELEALGSVFSAAANEPEPELVLQLEEEPEDLLELQEAPELVVEPAAALAAVEETAAAYAVAEAAADEVAQAPAVPEAWQLAETVVTSEAAPAPEVVSDGPVEVVPEAVVPAVVPEPALVLAPESLAATVIDAISETEPEPEEELVVAAPEPEEVPVVAAGVPVPEPDRDVTEVAEVVSERVEVTAAADDGEIEDEAGDLSGEWTVPDVPWMPPADATAGVPAMDASAARMTEEEMHQLFPPPAPPPPAPARGAAPIARLESFLQKVASRRLHLSPDSVA